jgi:hypothetical protein
MMRASPSGRKAGPSRKKNHSSGDLDERRRARLTGQAEVDDLGSRDVEQVGAARRISAPVPCRR